MLKEAIASAASLEEAKEAALAKLNAPEGIDVSVELIERVEEKKKVLGLFGGSPAKYTYKASYEEPEEPENPFAKAEDYLKMMLVGLGIENPSVTFEEAEEDILVTLDCGEDYGSVIGRRGETLDAIQYLTRLVINKGNEGYKRVSLNVGDYREKRESTLRALARKNAARVKKYGRNVVLDPMNPYERRIIHTTIQEIEGVTSHSVGSDGDRKVVISLEDGVKPTNGGNGNYRNNRGGRDNRGGRAPREKYQPQVTNRPPRSDSTGATLYGKIEVNKD